MLDIRELVPALKKVYFELRKEKRNQYKRDLPFADYVVDRWEKAEAAGFGKGSSIYDASLVLGDVKVGENCWIGPFTILDGSGGLLSIGDHCDISAGVQIYTHDTVNRVIKSENIETAPVTIGNHVYIGPNTVIAKGVTIGDYVVIGTNSFVNSDIPSHCKAFGTPARIVEKIT